MWIKCYSLFKNLIKAQAQDFQKDADPREHFFFIVFIVLEYKVQAQNLGCAIAQVADRRPLTSETQVHAHVTPMQDLWWAK